MIPVAEPRRTVTDAYSYEAFGAVRKRVGTNSQPFQYLGNAYDGTTKLYDFHARAYDSGVGRFVSEDLIAGHVALPQTLNPYAYGRNGPFVYLDPSGLTTLGSCVEGGGFFPGGEGMVQLCYVTDGKRNGVTWGWGAGAATPMESLSKFRVAGGQWQIVPLQYTDAECLEELVGDDSDYLKGGYGGWSAVQGVVVSGTSFGGEDGIQGFEIGAGVGVKGGIPFGAHGGVGDGGLLFSAPVPPPNIPQNVN